MNRVASGSCRVVGFGVVDTGPAGSATTVI